MADHSLFHLPKPNPSKALLNAAQRLTDFRAAHQAPLRVCDECNLPLTNNYVNVRGVRNQRFNLHVVCLETTTLPLVKGRISPKKVYNPLAFRPSA